MGGCMGLDYAGVKAVIDISIKKSERATVFKGIQVMEMAALKVLNKAGA